MLEGMSGIGIVTGLFGGSIVYEVMGYEAVFMTWGMLLLAMAVISRTLFMAIESRK